MRNSTRQLKLTVKINVMGQFNILLQQGIVNYKRLESNMGKTMILILCEQYRAPQWGMPFPHNRAAIDTVNPWQLIYPYNTVFLTV